MVDVVEVLTLWSSAYQLPLEVLDVAYNRELFRLSIVLLLNGIFLFFFVLLLWISVVLVLVRADARVVRRHLFYVQLYSTRWLRGGLVIEQLSTGGLITDDRGIFRVIDTADTL